MSTFFSFLNLGLEHILSPDATDHLLYLLALVLPFRFRHGLTLVKVITGFTLGHSLTLALAASGLLKLPSALIESAIPLTIFLTLLFQFPHLKSPGREPEPLLVWSGAFFGLIHGLGFANTLHWMLGKEASLVLPLLGFNVGVELAQMLVLAFWLVLWEGADRLGTSVQNSLRSVLYGLSLFWSLAMFAFRVLG